MKLQFTETQIKEREITLPCFVKYGDSHFYKVISEKKVVVITTYNFSTQIQVVDLNQCNPFNLSGWELTDESEYFEAEEKALNTLSEYTTFPLTANNINL